MFGSNGSSTKNESVKSGKSSTGALSPGGLNSINKGTTIEGSIKASSDIRIDGKIKGQLICDSKVIIGPSGHVDGEIRCQNAVIEGKFEGNLYVKEMLNVRETAHITGEVSTDKLIVQPGGIFNVACAMGGKDKGIKLSHNKPESKFGHETKKEIKV